MLGGDALGEEASQRGEKGYRKGGSSHARAHVPPETPSLVICTPAQLFSSPLNSLLSSLIPPTSLIPLASCLVIFPLQACLLLGRGGTLGPELGRGGTLGLEQGQGGTLGLELGHGGTLGSELGCGGTLYQLCLQDQMPHLQDRGVSVPILGGCFRSCWAGVGGAAALAVSRAPSPCPVREWGWLGELGSVGLGGGQEP